jgi:hypothetical protein
MRERIQLMNAAYIGVWIDHALAKIAKHTEGQEPRFKTLISHVEPHYRSGHSGVRRRGHVGGSEERHLENRRQEHLHRFYDRVIEEIRGCRAYKIMGPGEAKGELLRRIASKRGVEPPVKVETASKLTDRQLLARVRALADADASAPSRQF